jgi:hypothetical protein
MNGWMQWQPSNLLGNGGQDGHDVALHQRVRPFRMFPENNELERLSQNEGEEASNVRPVCFTCAS